MAYQDLRDRRTDSLLTKTVNLNGRQTKNAGDATDSQDYVPLAQVKQMIADAIKPLQDQINSLTTQTDTFVKGVNFTTIQYLDWGSIHQTVDVATSVNSGTAVTGVTLKK